VTHENHIAACVQRRRQILPGQRIAVRWIDSHEHRPEQEGKSSDRIEKRLVVHQMLLSFARSTLVPAKNPEVTMARIRIMRVAVDAMILPFCFPDKSKSLALYGTNSNTMSARACDDAMLAPCVRYCSAI
jgi:hypothetical protein